MIGCTLLAASGLGLSTLIAACDQAPEGEEVAQSREALLPPPVERLSEDLGLGDEQRARLEAVHDIIGDHREGRMAEKEQHFQWLRTSVETGQVDETEVHEHIDAKIDELRGLAHRVADELIPLVRSLDEDQRAKAVEKLDGFHDRMQRFHERMEAEGGPHAFFAKMRDHWGGGPGGWLEED